MIKQIVKLDSSFSVLAERFPSYPLVGTLKKTDSPFESLVRTIIGQQLSGKAAQTIADRLREHLEIAPSALHAATASELRSIGLSSAKARSIQELATCVVNGLDLLKLVDQPAAEIRTVLTQIWGIGNWTVDMFLMFDLHQPDIWPINDLGVQKGWQRLHDQPERPTPQELQNLGERFLGIRSAVAWYCWRALEV